MSSYPSWWNTTITIYNKYVDPQTQVVRWFGHVIGGCFWKSSGSKIKVNDVTISTDTFLCRIRESTLFKEKQDWMILPAADKLVNFTVGLGDIIVRGAVSDSIDEYVAGKRSSDLLQKYKMRGCIEVQKVAINVGGGRNSPHYYVEGV